MYCPQCGTHNEEGRERCIKCTAVLAIVPSPPPLSGQPASGQTDPVEIFIPYRNGWALASYYLAVFSLIPCLGLPLSIAAVACGGIGLSKARKEPQLKGKAHAWVGILLGGFVLLVYVALFVVGIVSAVLESRGSAYSG